MSLSNSRRIHHVCALGDYTQHEKDVRNARRAYYGAISYVDEKIGSLLKALDNSGVRDSTAIVFVSDHGEMLGNRGVWYKMLFYEWSCRVPMLFCLPRRFAPQRVSQVVSLVDILPTITEMAAGGQGAAYAESPEGRSLLPILEGGTIKDESIYGEILAETAIYTVLMIRDRRFKYIYCKKDPEQLFDVVADPNELNNLAAAPDYQEIRQSFFHQVQEKWDLGKLNKKVLASQKRRQVVNRALYTGHRTSWDFQPFDDPSQRYMRSLMDLNEVERTARYPVPDVPIPDGLNTEE